VIEHETSGPALIRVALIAPADDAPDHVEALQRTGLFRVAAQGGLPQNAVAAGVAWSDDLRVLLAQTELDAVLLVGSVRNGVELAADAIARGLHVWRQAPLGRTFAETTDLLRRARQAERVLHVPSWWDHIREGVRGLLRADDGFRAAISELRIAAVGPELASWRSSLVDAGGGVLSLDAYALLECLVALRGVPDSVAASVGRCRLKSTPAPRETEDTAAALLRYSGGDSAMVMALWDVPPYESAAWFHSASISVRVDRQGAAAYNATGAMTDQRSHPSDFLAADLVRFAADIAAHEHAEALVRQERHAAVASILEAAYLSARTGQPESPRRLYEAQKWAEPKR
jgi:predicted dehydrogenase